MRFWLVAIASVMSCTHGAPILGLDAGDAEGPNDGAAVDGGSDGATDGARDVSDEVVPSDPDWATDVAGEGEIFAVAVDPKTHRGVAVGYASNSTQQIVLYSFEEDGTLDWKSVLTSGVAWDVAVDANGNAYVAAYAENVDLGGGSIGRGAVCVKYSPTGEYVWAFGPFPGADFEHVRLAADGTVVLAGLLSSATDFGGGTMTPSSGGLGDALALEIDGNGNYVRARSWASPGNVAFANLAVDAQKNVLVGGSFGGTVDFGNGPHSSTAGTFIVKLTPTLGYAAELFIDGTASAGLGDFAFDSLGNVLVGLWSEQSFQLGGMTLPPQTGKYGGIVFAKLDPSLNAVWAKEYSGTFAIKPWSVTVGPSDSLVASGLFAGSIDIGTGTLTAGTQQSLFLVRIDPSGSTVASLSFGPPNGGSEGHSAQFVGNGDYFVAGMCTGTLTLPDGNWIVCGNNGDGFVGRLAMP